MVLIPLKAPAVVTFKPEPAVRAKVVPVKAKAPVEFPIVVAEVPVELIKVVPKMVVAPLMAFVPPEAPIVLAADVPVPNVLVRDAPVPIVELPEEVRVVKEPVEGVPEPIAPGLAKVAPFKEEAFKLATLVVEATTNGAVPEARVEVIWPEAERVVVETPVSPEKAPAEERIAVGVLMKLV